jgi:hypothetical protein
MAKRAHARKHKTNKVVPISLLQDRRREAGGSERISAASARAGAVAKFRELADRIERGELDGARAQWRAGLHALEVVEIVHATETFPGRVQLLAVEIDSPERPANPPRPHYTEED